MSWDKFQPEDEQPHVDTDTCGKCRKKFAKGHRVSIANIIAEVGFNPERVTEKGCQIYPEYEMVHIDCRDPFLKRGLVS